MRYDLHIHTKYSKCASLDPLDILKIAKKRELDGIAVTDHNTMEGALKVSKLNKDKDFEVVVGSEIKTNLGDVLVYYQTEEIKEREFPSVLDKIKEQGGFACVAHPCRIVPWNKFKGDFSKVDCCVETFNSRTLPFENVRASKIAKKHNLVGLGGSDAHFKFDIGKGYTLFDGDLKKSVHIKRVKTGGTTRYGIISGLMSFLKKRIIRH